MDDRIGKEKGSDGPKIHGHERSSGQTHRFEHRFIDHRIGDMHRFCTGCYIVLLQQKYGLVPIPEGFLVDRYPIEIKWFDF